MKPPGPVHEFNRVIQLEDLREAARVLEEDASPVELREQMRRVLEPTTSMGGARPKNTVEDDTGLWLAKFPAHGYEELVVPPPVGRVATMVIPARGRPGGTVSADGFQRAHLER